MQIIPVIDLKDGFVVSAQQGLRDQYQPIHSYLSASCKIEDVVNGFLSLHPFNTLYIADLNAIMRSGNNRELIDKVISDNNNIEFWIDDGLMIEESSSITDTRYKSIIGSENQYRLNSYHTESIKKNILSLDFFPNIGYKGPVDLIENKALWPKDIIIMSLDHVGNNNGPDFERLLSFLNNYPENNIIAAGGIRNKVDLINLNKIGVNQVLIASALHSGMITADIIKSLEAKKYPVTTGYFWY